MATLNLLSAFSMFTAFARSSPPSSRPMFFFPPLAPRRRSQARPHVAAITRAQDAVLAHGQVEPRQRARLLCEPGHGTLPTIVLGGFVPDSTEQVFLLRDFLLGRGNVYYLNYPRGGFSPELLYAQLDDLVTELNERRGQRPVIFSVSFGSGLLLEWLRRTRAAGRRPALAGVVLVSPVACADDLIVRGEAKPGSLLGRALKPYMLETGTPVAQAGIEKSRAIFARMFEAGAQNRAALRALMGEAELQELREKVLKSIKDIDAAGACERVQALRQMTPLPEWATPGSAALLHEPALILFAENEDAVMTPNSPTRAVLESMHRGLFPRGELQRVANADGGPVQHASLIFHHFQFLPPITSFYRGLKAGKLRTAA